MLVPIAASSVAGPPPVAAFGAPARCRGFRKDGKPCQWNAASNCTIAAPLQNGCGYCMWHLPQDDCRQQRLDKFMVRAGMQTEQKLDEEERGEEATQQTLFTQLARYVPTPARSQATTQLTQEQCERIAESRRKALERRQQRQADSCQGSERGLTLSQCLQRGDPLVPVAGADVHLTQEQHARIARNRALAIERQHRRQLETEPIAKAVAMVNAEHSSNNSVPSSGSSDSLSSSLAPGSDLPPAELVSVSKHFPAEQLHSEQQPGQQLEEQLEQKFEQKLEQTLEQKLEQRLKQKLEQQLQQEQQQELQQEQQQEQQCASQQRSRSPARGVNNGQTPPKRRRRLVACITGSPPPQAERSSRALQQASSRGLCTGASDGAALAIK